MPSPDSIRFVYVTAPDRERALAIGRTLVERRLAACVNVLDGMTSVYRWQGRVEEASEAVLLVKTAARLVPAVTEAVKELHEYEVPCVVALTTDGGNAAYLEWLASALL